MCQRHTTRCAECGKFILTSLHSKVFCDKMCKDRYNNDIEKHGVYPTLTEIQINVLQTLIKRSCLYCRADQRLIRFSNKWYLHIWPESRSKCIGCFEQEAHEMLRELGIQTVDALI